MQTKVKLGWFAAAILAAAAPLQAADLIPLGSSWKYVLGTQEASTPVDAWRAVSYSDAAWLSGVGPLGYDTGGTPGTAPIATTLPDPRTAGNPAWNSTYFRKTFTIANPAAVSELILTVYADDGAIAWVNGQEVGRINVAEGDLAYNGAAVVADETRTMTTTNIASKLVAGNNVVAVHVFNGPTSSSDFVFEGILTAALDAPPAVESIDPFPSSIVQSLTFVDVIFNESVTGVDAADLRINGTPATSVTVVSPREYVFNFPQPPTGAVSVAWAPAPGIADIDQQADLFVPGAAWGYTLDPNVVAASVVISEFMTDNENGIRDEDGTRGDWIEIYNPGVVDVNLNGYYLSDVTNNLTKWRFPSVVLGANRYLIVWATEKDRANSAAPLHTNFRLGKDGGHLLLVDPATNIISSFSPYPVQSANVSYGRDRVDPNLLGYFTTPTPGAQNASSGAGFAPEPTFSLASGIYTNNSLTLTITVPANTTVRYTLNGTEPTNNSPAYAAPITFTTNMMLKARSFPTAPNVWPSPVVARSFVMLDTSSRDFNSNIPILIMSTMGQAIPQNLPPGAQRTRGIFVSIDTFRGRSALQGEVEHFGLGGFEIVGQTSAGFAKQPLRLELQDALGNDESASLLGMPAEADWNLRNPHNDKTLMNDFLGYELWESMGRYSCRRRFVEVFLDRDGGKTTYPGDYYGVMVLLERIERDNDRVDIAELTPSHITEPNMTGGYIFKKDKDSTGDLNFTTTGGAGHSAQTLKLHEPKPNSMRTAQGVTTTFPGTGYTPSASNQLGYLLAYLNRFEASMYAPNWTNATGTNHYSYYIDVDAFVDQHLHVEFTKQIDGYRISSFYSKDRGGKVRPDPVWDWNLAFGNANYLKGGMTNGWYWADEAEGMNSGNHIWLRRLVFGAATGASATMPSGTGSGDAEFRQKVTDRWGVLRTNVFNGDRLVARINELETLLTEAADRNWAKYPNVLNVYQWPNPEGGTFHVDFTQPTSALIVAEMKKWVKGRYLWMDSQFLQAPALNLNGGDIQPGFAVAIGAPQGTIYYTLDGTDPRLPGGGISPSAAVYSGPVTLNGNARVVARAYFNSLNFWTPWSPAVSGTFVTQKPRLVITEIMYHPTPGPLGSPYTDEDFEYVELRNVGAGPLNVTGYSLSGGIDFTFPNLTLAAGQRVVVVKNQAAFLSRYSSGATIAGQYTGNLNNNDNRLVLQGKLKEPIHDFVYSDQWYPITDGFGFSLVIVNDAADSGTWGLASSWRPSGVVNGTPGQGDGAAPSIPQVVVNEALTHSDPAPPTDTIELRNLTGSPANIGGWFLTDDFNTPKKYRIILGTTIPANGYITFNESQFNVGGGGGNVAFSLSSSGDEVYLFSGDTDGNLTGYYHGFAYGAAKNGVTFGRHITSTSEEHFVALSNPTLGAANSGLLVGPVVVSEIMYRPREVFANGAYWNNEEDEFIELRNITGSPVSLFDPARQTNTWRLGNAVQYQFPASTTLAANGYLLVVNFNPATDPVQLGAFRTKYGIPQAVPIFGPYSGNLANSTEAVSLYLPDAPETTGTGAGTIPYVLVDEVHYSDQVPWPAAADGLGHSLHRLNATAYGDDPINWAAGGPTPGNGFTGGTSPTIVQNPVNQSIPATASVTFSGGATGPGPLSFQWRFNGEVINGATNSTLLLSNVQGSQAGQYQLFVLNPFGFTASSAATLTVLIPANISQNPLDQKVPEGTNVTFTVVATSINPPLTYQWYYNGEPIAGANGFSYSINNVTDIHEGNYACALSDGSGTIFSTAAALKVLIFPTMIVPNPDLPSGPLNLTAVAGETVTLSAITRGTKPMLYRWRRYTTAGATIVTNDVRDSNVAFLVLPNVTAAAAGTYTLVLTNEVYTNPNIQRTNAYLTVLADANSNGVPDQWEAQYFPGGLDPLADSDGDGMNNKAEYIAGTNPTDAASYLKVSSLTPSEDAIVTFAAISNKTYTVEYKDGLDSLIWNRLGDVVARNANWTANVVDTQPGTNRFYRIVTPKRP